MVHIVRLRTRKNRLFGQAKNGSIWMHNHQAWTAEQLKKLVALVSEACELRQEDASSMGYGQLNRYIDIDCKQWTKVRGAS